MIIVNSKHNIIIANDAQVANTFFTRLKGLLGTSHLGIGKGLIIRPCNSIHTVAMKYPIDVLFMDEHDKVLKIANDMTSGKFSLCRNSSYVVELPAGVAVATGTAVGDKLSITEEL